MNTANVVLMCVLCTMIGFGMGSAWGKESMKRTLTTLLDQLIKGVQVAAEQGTKKGIDIR